MKLAILTSNHLRHQFFVNTLIEQFEVVALLQEEKKRDPSKKGEGTDMAPVVEQYFADRSASEQDFFGEHTSIAGLAPERCHSVPAGDINDPSILAILEAAAPDYIAVFGSSIIGEAIIAAFPNRIINMHLGLSPYYRGSGTNFWPLYDEVPEYVGVTIHYLDAGIDTGKLIVQGRPEIEPTDTPHSIGNKTITVGAHLMADTLQHLADGNTIAGVAQDHSVGKLCLFKDCTPEHIQAVGERCAAGMIKDYCERIAVKGDMVAIVDKTSW